MHILIKSNIKAIQGSLHICCIASYIVTLKCPNLCKLAAKLCKLA